MRKSFTLIELIFTIVVIAILAGIAIPKYIHLKKAAEVRQSVKNALEGAKEARDVAVNLAVLENNLSFKLRDLVKIEGSNWRYDTAGDGTYIYSNPEQVVRINLNKTHRYIKVWIKCWGFKDAYRKDECGKMVGLPVPLSYYNSIYSDYYHF